MLLFSSEGHVLNWCRNLNVPYGYSFSLDQGWQLAREWYRDRLDAAWKRRTPDEAQAVFDSIGLTGDFWRL